MSKRKLAIIALDGAAPQLIKEWSQAGHLPNIASLIEGGAFGPLESVVPPVTGAAWGSFVTGVMPGRHGIFEWLRRQDKSYKLGLINSTALPFQTLFEWLSQHDLKVGVMSVPLSYPIRDVNGFVVSDLLTPTKETYTSPHKLQDEIEELLGASYPLAPPPWPGRPRAEGWIKDLKQSLTRRSKSAIHLAKTQEWDLFMLHVMESDSVQHQMWQQIDTHKRKRYRLDLGEQNPILEIYKQCDELIGELVSDFDDDTAVMIISDHGFGPHLYNLHLNTWLLRNGFLKLKINFTTLLKRSLFELGIVPENLYPWEENLRLLGKAKSDQAYEWLGRFTLSTQNIDWDQSVAYSYGNVGQIYLNRIGREPQGIVGDADSEEILGEIEKKLRAWSNPQNGEAVIGEIFRKNEIYTDKALERAPDLVFLPTDGYSPMGLSEFLSNRTLTHPVAHSGWHRLDGVFIGSGEPFAVGHHEGLKLIDLFPTICQIMNVPTPDHVDGNLASSLSSDLLDSEIAASPTAASQNLSGADQASLTATEEEELRERLKGLGYM